MARSEDGSMSWVEILLLAVIGLLLGGAALVQVSGSTNCPGKASQTRAALMQLHIQVKLFKIDQDRYPESLEDLYRQPAYVGQDRWPAGGYIAEPPIDAWGRDFLYKLPGSRSEFEVGSLGADGKPGGEGMDADQWLLR